MPLSLNNGFNITVPDWTEEVNEECAKVLKGELATLNLSYMGVREIPQCTYSMGNHLTRLTCGGNKLTSISEEIGSLTKLHTLNLWSNKLTQIPDTIGELTNLSVLSIFDNNLTTLPPSFQNLTSLTELHLSRNPFVSLPVSIGSLKSLTLLKLQKCTLTSIPHELSNLSNLIQLDLSENNLQEFPSVIFSLNNLEVLEIQNNKITTLLPNDLMLNGASSSSDEPIHHPCWEGLVNLRVLILLGNLLDSIPPNTISLLPRLETLNLSNNKVVSLPYDIQQNTSLTSLDLSSNGLVELPEGIGLLKNLKHLDASYNDIEKLPKFEELPNLQRYPHFIILFYY